MNAADTIAAAIEKLSGMRAKATDGPWSYEYGYLDGADGIPVNDLNVECGRYCLGGTACGMADEDANLIVALHRTIDAQIAVLQGELTFALAHGWPASPFQERLAVLALANAILGT